MLCLIFLPKLASKINRNKCPFYFFDMPFLGEMSILTVYIRLVNVYTRLTYKVGVHSILKSCKLLGILMKNQTSLLNWFFNSHSRLLKLAGAFSQLKYDGLLTICARFRKT